MKQLTLRLLLLGFFMSSLFFVTPAMAQDHDAVADSISIDDMDPVFYTEEDEEAEESEGSNGVVIGIAIGLVIVGGGAYMVAKKKK